MNPHLTELRTSNLNISQLSYKLRKVQQQINSDLKITKVKRPLLSGTFTMKHSSVIQPNRNSGRIPVQKYSKLQLENHENATVKSEFIRHALSTKHSSRHSFVMPSPMLPQKSYLVRTPKSALCLDSFPVTPSVACSKFKGLLTTYEQGEILDYPEIYFIGPHAVKIQSNPYKENYGYDNEKGDYRITKLDHIGFRYEIKKMIGKGSFGQILEVHDHKTRTNLALKILKNKARFHKQGTIEVKILRTIGDSDPKGSHRIISIKDSFLFRSHLCITFDLLSLNLYEFIALNHFRGCSLSLVKRFGRQILQSLQLLKSLKIIHCDLKPENILLEHERTSVQVIDLGSACFEGEKLYTYIQSRFYRAPEILLGVDYTPAIDMWSFGCLLAELHTGVPLFPGESELEQLQCMMEVKGTPPKKILLESTKKEKFFECDGTPKAVARGKRRVPGSKRLCEALNGASVELLQLIERCLTWSAEQRITPEEALNHSFFEERVPSVPGRQKRSFLHSTSSSISSGTVPSTTKHREGSFAF